MTALLTAAAILATAVLLVGFALWFVRRTNDDAHTGRRPRGER